MKVRLNYKKVRKQERTTSERLEFESGREESEDHPHKEATFIHPRPPGRSISIAETSTRPVQGDPVHAEKATNACMTQLTAARAW